MKKRPYSLLLLAALLLVVGCRSPKPAADRPSPRDSIADDRPLYTVLSFSGTVEGIGVSGQIRIARDSVIWASATKVIEVGRAMATPDSVWVRSTLLGINEACTLDQARRRAGLDLTFADMQELLLSDDPAPRLEALAQRLGRKASLRITRRQQVKTLTFPFPK